jgi:predicted permease
VNWLQRLVRRRRLERELNAELEFHFDRQVADNRRAGMSDREAHRHARLLVGGLDQLKEACRDARGTRWLTDSARDVYAAVRSLRATPTFTLVAVLVLTFGIGASTAIFSVVDAVVLRGLPFNEGHRLIAVSELDRNGQRNATSPQNYADWKAARDVLADLAAVTWADVDLKREGQQAPEGLRGKRVTAEFFSVLRVNPLKGRVFTADDEVDGHDAVAVISYGLWQRRFGGASDVVGKRLPGADRSLEIVGVMPRGFDYPPGVLKPTDVWRPYVIPADQRVRPGNGHYWNLQLVGRLRDDATFASAQARLDQITSAVRAAYPDWSSGMTGVRVEPLRDALTGDTRAWMFLLLGAVSFVLLLACVNVANLLLVRATTRSRELAVRAALGATRWDLARALLSESVVLSGVGAACGVLVAWWGVALLRDAMPVTMPRVALVAVNFRVLMMATATALTTGVVFGLLPALSFSRPALNGALKDGGRGATPGGGLQWVRTVLVVSEVALAVVLLVGAGLFLASFARVTHVDLGMNIEHLVTVRIAPPADVPGKRQRIADVLDRVAAMPGVDAAAVAGSAVPMFAGRISYPIRVPGRPVPADSVGIDKREVSPDYFRVLEVPLEAGRYFSTVDRRGGNPVAILNHTAAKRYFGESAAAVGQRVQIESESALREVVGVVADVRQFGPEQSPNAAFFVPFAQSDQTWGTLLVRTAGDKSAVGSAVNAAIWAEFPDNVPETNTLRDVLDARLAARRFNMLLLGLFGLLGLVIAALGIYGVMSYVVTQRTHEIGIRMALGAAPSQMLRAILTRTVVVLGVGLVMGAASAWGLAGLAEKFLFEVRPHDPSVYTGVGFLLLVTGLLAAIVPARRAGRIDPLVALRLE